jgi:hypothetical protein
VPEKGFGPSIPDTRRDEAKFKMSHGSTQVHKHRANVAFPSFLLHEFVREFANFAAIVSCIGVTAMVE